MNYLPEAALAAGIGLGAYELYHHHRYGNFGFGNPYNNGGGFQNFGGYGSSYGYGAPSGFGGGGFGHHHHHRMF